MNQMLRQTLNIYTNKDERACSKRDKKQNKRKQLTYQSLYAGGLKSHFINQLCMHAEHEQAINESGREKLFEGIKWHKGQL